MKERRLVTAIAEGAEDRFWALKRRRSPWIQGERTCHSARGPLKQGGRQFFAKFTMFPFGVRTPQLEERPHHLCTIFCRTVRRLSCHSIFCLMKLFSLRVRFGTHTP